MSMCWWLPHKKEHLCTFLNDAVHIHKQVAYQPSSDLVCQQQVKHERMHMAIKSIPIIEILRKVLWTFQERTIYNRQTGKEEKEMLLRDECTSSWFLYAQNHEWTITKCMLVRDRKAWRSRKKMTKYHKLEQEKSCPSLISAMTSIASLFIQTGYYFLEWQGEREREGERELHNTCEEKSSLMHQPATTHFQGGSGPTLFHGMWISSQLSQNRNLLSKGTGYMHGESRKRATSNGHTLLLLVMGSLL